MAQEQYSGPLPSCEGPKLRPFAKSTAAVKFKRLLSDPESEGQAHVFEAVIGSRTYAIKVFRFYDIEEDRFALIGKENDRVTDEVLRYHVDPFYRECRAYGRLIEKDLNGKVAVRCYGYMTFPAETEDKLEQMFQVTDWDRLEDYCDRDQPLRAIVKDLVVKEVPWTSKVLDKTLTAMKRMRRCGVYPGDICQRNYKGGLLVDLGAARTEPYFIFDIRPGRQTLKMKNSDLYMWEDMRKELGFNTRLRALRDVEYCKKFRERKTKPRKSRA